jgi:hypothetical protein
VFERAMVGVGEKRAELLVRKISQVEDKVTDIVLCDSFSVSDGLEK